MAPRWERTGATKVLAGSSRYHAMLQEFPDIILLAGISLETRLLQPITYAPRRTSCNFAPTAASASAKSEFDEMLRNGTARRSYCPWVSPFHLFPKNEDGWKPCVDYRALNARTVPDQYPVRHIADFAHQLPGRKFFSTIDLVKAYHQIPIHSDDISQTAIASPFGLFEIPYMLFGLRNSAQTFQLFIDESLRDLDFCYAYIGDVLVASNSED